MLFKGGICVYSVYISFNYLTSQYTPSQHPQLYLSYIYFSKLWKVEGKKKANCGLSTHGIGTCKNLWLLGNNRCLLESSEKHNVTRWMKGNGRHWVDWNDSELRNNIQITYISVCYYSQIIMWLLSSPLW